MRFGSVVTSLALQGCTTLQDRSILWSDRYNRRERGRTTQDSKHNPEQALRLGQTALPRQRLQGAAVRRSGPSRESAAPARVGGRDRNRRRPAPARRAAGVPAGSPGPAALAPPAGGARSSSGHVRRRRGHFRVYSPRAPLPRPPRAHWRPAPPAPPARGPAERGRFRYAARVGEGAPPPPRVAHVGPRPRRRRLLPPRRRSAV